ncbi:hypothetical protein PMG11_00108 [Penicillium brasilianum]|uniref:Uncharacterized protein n=1 Tax=Penicillium brasilianum TaxID=104259 RepID=A0A0F7TD68_PENBI|nr:hypothetical protein PMG11_00108 [Penicillium brasilianum]
MSDPRLVDMEPGGESTQYESIREFTLTPEKATGQLGVGQPHTKSEKKFSLGSDENGTGDGEDEDEYAMAQRLGMGQCAEDKGN